MGRVDGDRIGLVLRLLAAQPLLLGASAKVLLAYMEPELCLSILRQQGVEEADVAAHLDSYGAIRSAGHAVSLSEIDLGIWGVSAPLLDSRDRLQGAISLMAPAFRAEQVAYGLERVKLFSWEQTARQLLALYESLGR